MWVEFVVGSRTCSKGFSLGSPVFLPPQKPINTPISNSISVFDHYIMLNCVAGVKYLFIYLVSMSWKQFYQYFCFILFRSDFFERVERVLQGLIEENCPVNSRTIRIFMSSTFTGNILFLGETPLMSHYMGRLRPKRVPFLGSGIWFNLFCTTWKLQKDLRLWGFIRNRGEVNHFVKGIPFFQEKVHKRENLSVTFAKI